MTGRAWRLWLRRIHLVLALTVGVVFASLAASGSLLVFRGELTRQLAPPPPWDGRSMSVGEARKTALDLEPGARLSVLWFPTEARPWFEALLVRADGEEVSRRFDPVGGREMTPQGGRVRWLEWVEEFHCTLFLGGTGRWIVGHVTLLALFLVLGGVILWWPGWRPHLWFALRGGKLRDFDLHRVSGLLAAPVLLLCIATGLSWAFPGTSRNLVFLVAGLGGPGPEDVPPHDRRLTVSAGSPATDEQLIGDALSRAPEGSLVFYVTEALEPGVPRQVRVQRGYEPYPFGEVHRYYYDPGSGELIGSTDAGGMAGPDRILERWSGPLHFGTFGGPVILVVYAVSTLVPLLLAMTGVRLWWRRTRGSRLARCGFRA